MSSSDQTIQEIKEHVLSYCKPSDFKAWLNFGMCFVYEAIAIALIHLNLGILGWTLHTFNVVRLFIAFHDMAHFSYWSSFALNKWIGKLVGIYVHFPFNSWRDGHNHHHKHFGNLDRLDLSQTILFTKKQYEEWSTPKKILIRIFR